MIEKLFGFNPKSMTIRKEVMGGITTFLTMAYILAVNPLILSQSGMEQGAVFTATAISSIVATLVMAIYAKLPFALAPGMGINAFFVYTICIAMGYSWQFGLTAVFVEGLLFITFTITGIRQKIVETLPLFLRRSISAGIGLFITFVGLHNANIIVENPSTLVSLGDFHSSGVLLSFFGIIFTAILLIRKVTGAPLIGIIVATIVGIPLGITHFGGIIDLPPSLEPVLFKFEWENILTIDMLICIATLLFMDMFDTIGTLVGVSNDAGMMDENGNVPRLKEAFMADAVGTTVGAILGTSTVSTYVESAAGVNVGGRSGLTAFTTAICFVLALFFSPVFLSIPSEATAPILVLVGVMMMHDIVKIDFHDFLVAIPCFLTIIIMPFASSISDGIMIGFITYVVLNVFAGKWCDINIASYILAVLFICKYAFL